MAESKEHIDILDNANHEDVVHAKIIHGWTEFLETSSIPGMPKVGVSKLPMKIIWLMLVATGSSIFMWQANDLVSTFMQQPVAVAVSVVTQRDIDFPSVTICNLNTLRKSKVMGTRFEPIVSFDIGLENKTEANKTTSAKKRRSVNEEIQRQKRLGSTSTVAPTTTIGGGGGGGGPPGTDTTLFPGQPGGPGQDFGTTLSPEEQLSNLFDDIFSPPDPNAPGSDKSPSFMDPNEWGFSQYSDYGSDPNANPNANPNGNPNFENIQLFVPEITTNFSRLTSDSDYLGMIKASKADDFSDIVKLIYPTRDEIIKYGHDAADMIVQCTFDGIDCSYKSFYAFENKKYGRCYTFNAGLNNKIYATRRFGSQYGLTLTLHPQEEEYLGLMSHNVGFRLLVHSHNITPYPEDLGINIGPGISTQVAIRKNAIFRYPGFGGCQTTDDTSTDTANNATNTTKQYSYSVLRCIDDCLQTALQDRCNCSDRIPEKRSDICSITNTNESDCRRATMKAYNNGEIDCPCLQSCTDIFYSLVASTSKWPSKRYDRILNYKLKSNYSTDELVNVQIFFEELNFEQVLESEGYPMTKLLADIGGILGLYVGMSLLAIFEIFELFYMIGRTIYLKSRPIRVGPDPKQIQIQPFNSMT